MAAFAISPGLRAPEPQLMWISFRIGPLIIKKGAQEPVLTPKVSNLDRGSIRDFTAAIRTGMWVGRAPAMTALTAIFSTVAFGVVCAKQWCTQNKKTIQAVAYLIIIQKFKLTLVKKSVSIPKCMV
jgi:hypothetical protein